MSTASDYYYGDASPSHTHSYLLPTVLEHLRNFEFPTNQRRVLDLGCGNGSAAAHLSKNGFTPTGIDPSESGIEQARSNFSNIEFHIGSAYDSLKEKHGSFPVVMSLEVVEHVYSPRDFAQTIFDVLVPGGLVILSTPYHGYLKNLLIAITNSYDRHHDPLWDHGHIKFWSMDTLSQLLEEIGFAQIRFDRVGRIPPLAKSMIALARKPEGVSEDQRS
jgi:2-polyprenyl-6-hydroxyphenyl methylase/3-demethylubiquinone-9 3-methyltransferase